MANIENVLAGSLNEIIGNVKVIVNMPIGTGGISVGYILVFLLILMLVSRLVPDE